LSHWFRNKERAKTIALFMLAVPVSNIIGSPLSGLLLKAHWFGLEGWRWLFIIQGTPAVIFGVITIFFLTDWPHEAKWLSGEEREWISAELKRERESIPKTQHVTIWNAMLRRDVILLTLAYFFIISGIYGFNFWLPTILKRLSGLPDLQITLIAMLP